MGPRRADRPPTLTIASHYGYVQNKSQKRLLWQLTSQDNTIYNQETFADTKQGELLWLRGMYINGLKTVWYKR